VEEVDGVGEEGERRMNRSSGTVSGWFTQAILRWLEGYRQKIAHTKSTEVIDAEAQAKFVLRDNWSLPSFRFVAFENEFSSWSKA
jgi:hypothetical protein